MQTTIKIQNCYSWLKTDNNYVKNALWDSLRFLEKGYFHSRLYKQKLWDGYTEFYKKKTGKFLTGLLPEVKQALKIMNIDYKIIDERTSLEFEYDSIDNDFMDQWLSCTTPEMQSRWKGMHDYQVDLTNKFIKQKRGVIFSPTGSGKSATMVSCAKVLKKGTPILVLANKTTLCDQNYEVFKEWGFENVGRLYSKYKEPNTITCATIQSLHKIEDLLPHFKFLVVDEIHDMMSKKPKQFYTKLTNCSARIAVSATPFKFGGKDKCQKYSVKGHFGPVLKVDSEASVDGVVTTKKLQENGTLSKANCFFMEIKEPQIPFDIYLDAVDRGIANNWHFHDIVTKLAQGLPGRTLIIVERLDHGNSLHKMIPNSLWVQGKDNLETRKYVINELKTNKEKTIGIATQGIFNAGINVYVHNLINAAGGKADHQITQRFGRGLRVASDKEGLNYYDFIFDINEYLYDHSKKRVKILEKEGHNISYI